LSSFREFPLRPSSKKALEAMNIETPTEIQEASIPHLLAGSDVIGQAYTGSGKTLAFSLPLIERIDVRNKWLQALVLVPTRELAQQVGDVIEKLSKGAGIRSTLIYGGRSFGPQQDAIYAGAQVVVGTPGRVLDHLNRGTMRLDGITYLVLDEADEMLDRGFAPDVERILSQTNTERQTALFSATTPEWVHKVSQKYLKDPVVIETSRGEDEPGPDIDHVVYEVWKEDKLSVLLKLLDEPTEGTTLVFGRTKHGVRSLGLKLERLGYQVDVLQGNLSQGQRDRVIQKFRAGKTPVLLATNVAARGLDVLHITRVINYELPETAPAAWADPAAPSPSSAPPTSPSGVRSSAAWAGNCRASRPTARRSRSWPHDPRAQHRGRARRASAAAVAALPSAPADSARPTPALGRRSSPHVSSA
jgi:ATP-dependent RNA helicase DeaD